MEKVDPLLFFHAEYMVDVASGCCNTLAKSAEDVENSCPPGFPLKINAQLICDEIYGMKNYLSALVDDVAAARERIETLGLAKLPPKPNISKKKKQEKSLKSRIKSAIEKIKEKLGLETGAKKASKAKSKAGLLASSLETGALKSSKVKTRLSFSYEDAEKELKAFNAKQAEVTAKREKAKDETREIILNDAKSYVGRLNYVSGGTSLVTGADCSGFTQAIYSKNGYSIGRTTWDQKEDGIAIDATQDVMNGDFSKLKEGDLIICNNDGHVVMYAGNNTFVHSPHTGAKVSVDDYRLTGVTAVRRIVN